MKKGLSRMDEKPRQRAHLGGMYEREKASFKIQKSVLIKPPGSRKEGGGLWRKERGFIFFKTRARRNHLRTTERARGEKIKWRGRGRETERVQKECGVKA